MGIGVFITKRKRKQKKENLICMKNLMKHPDMIKKKEQLPILCYNTQYVYGMYRKKKYNK